MDKSIETLGFGHCLHLSSSRLLATPQLTGRGNAGPSGASVRSRSLSLPILTIDAATSTALARTCILSANLLLPAVFPPSSHLPAFSLGCRRQDFQPGLWVILSSGACPVLVATRKSPEVLGSSGNLLYQRRNFH